MHLLGPAVSQLLASALAYKHICLASFIGLQLYCAAIRPPRSRRCTLHADFALNDNERGLVAT